MKTTKNYKNPWLRSVYSWLARGYNEIEYKPRDTKGKMEDFLKTHRKLSAIGGVVGMIVGILASTETIWSLVSPEPLLPYILKNAPQWAKIILAIVFVAICIFCIVVVIKIYRQTKEHTKVKQPKIEIEKGNLLDTLTAMHRQLVELQKDKATHTKVTLEVLQKALPILADRMDWVKLEDSPKFRLDMELKIRRAIPPKPHITFRGRFRFNKWMRMNEEWKERAYLVAISIVKKEKDKFINMKEWTLADAIKAADWVDGYGWGVKELRDNDPRWTELYETIDNRFRIDDVLGNLIKEHIDLSRAYNNINLLTHYASQFKDDIYSLMVYEALVGSPMSPEQIDIGLNEILGKVDKRLKEMANR